MASGTPRARAKKWTVGELRALPAAQRDAILEEQAAAVEEEYRTNKDLTNFDAFGEDDLHGESSTTGAG